MTTITAEQFSDVDVLAKRFVVFENDGLIDLIGITTFGINAKLSENPIGYFGTGLKYAIAVLLRCGQKITIWRGDEPLHFEVVTQTSRGKDFSIVCMNGQPLGFTTDLGKTWEMWQAFRELFCNCQDEGGNAYETTDFNPRRGRTAVVVEGDQFFAAFQKRTDYILGSKPMFKLDGVEVHSGQSQTIFYKGIAVAQFPDNRRPMHTYNIIGHLELTEDRTVKYSWQPAERVAYAVQMTDNAEFIEEILKANPEGFGAQGGFEASLDFNFHGVTPNETFLSMVERLSVSNGPKINESAKCHAQKYYKPEPPTPLILDDTQQAQLDTAMGFCADLGFQVDEYPLRFVQALGAGVLGMAFGGEIVIARDAFVAGTKQLAITLIEEVIHLREGVADESRAMQERLLHELVTLGERLLDRPL